MMAKTIALRLKIADKPCIVWSLGPKASYFESLEPQGRHTTKITLVEGSELRICVRTKGLGFIGFRLFRNTYMIRCLNS